MDEFKIAADELLTDAAVKLSVLFNRKFWQLRKKVKHYLMFNSKQGIFGVKNQKGKLVFMPVFGTDYYFFRLRQNATSNSSIDIIDYCNIYFRKKLDKYILKGDKTKSEYYEYLLEHKEPQQ